MAAIVSDALAHLFASIQRGHLLSAAERVGHDVEPLRVASRRHLAGVPGLPVISPTWLVAEQVAELMGVTAGTVTRWCRPGGLLADVAMQHVQPGSRRATWRVDTAGLAQIMVDRRIMEERASHGRKVAGQDGRPAA